MTTNKFVHLLRFIGVRSRKPSRHALNTIRKCSFMTSTVLLMEWKWEKYSLKESCKTSRVNWKRSTMRITRALSKPLEMPSSSMT